MLKIAALVVSAALLVSVPFALASTGDSTQSSTPSPTIQPAVPACAPAKTFLSRKNWRDAHPLRGENVCPTRNLAKLKTGYYHWRAYRLIAPYSGCSSGGKWLRYTAIPGSVVYRESRCSWTAYNASSSACGPYQLLGWTSCDTSSWTDKMRHHRMAAYVLRVQGPGAWAAW